MCDVTAAPGDGQAGGYMPKREVMLPNWVEVTAWDVTITGVGSVRNGGPERIAEAPIKGWPSAESEAWYEAGRRKMCWPGRESQSLLLCSFSLVPYSSQLRSIS